ncbi:MAG: cytochrome c family protein [Desulfatitalea sp.]|nr:cytochrome c family protein [Desulfatitalea sp.]MBI5895003.1 cytochrome c family protein [Desulfobacterales bacterium]
MKKTAFTILTLCLTLCFLGAALAADKGNERKGKYTYRNVYKACFERGAVQSQKPLLNPDAKTQEQWTRAFESKDFEQFGCQQEWGALSAEDLGDVYAYLYEHAADSPSPAKCK